MKIKYLFAFSYDYFIATSSCFCCCCCLLVVCFYIRLINFSLIVLFFFFFFSCCGNFCSEYFSPFLFFFPPLHFSIVLLNPFWDEVSGIRWRIPDIVHHEFIQWLNIFDIILRVFLFAFLSATKHWADILRELSDMARRCLLCVAKYYLGPIFVLSRVIFTHVHLIAIELYLPFYHLNVLYCVCISSVKLMCKLSNLSHDLLNAEYQRYSALILKITLWRCRLFFPYGEKKTKQTTISFLSSRGSSIHRMTLSLILLLLLKEI